MNDNDFVPQDEEAPDELHEIYGIRILKSIRRIIRAVDIYSRKLNNDFNITTPQMICLYSLEKEGQLTQSQLAKKVNMGMSTINGVIDRLEKKSLIVKQRDTHDRRKVFIDVTEAGKAITKSAPSLLQDRLSHSLKKLPELEQAAMALSLEKIVQLMEVEHLEASPNLVPNNYINDKKDNDGS